MWNNFCTIMECMWDLFMFVCWTRKKKKKNWMCNIVNSDDEIYAFVENMKYEISSYLNSWKYILLANQSTNERQYLSVGKLIYW